MILDEYHKLIAETRLFLQAQLPQKPTVSLPRSLPKATPKPKKPLKQPDPEIETPIIIASPPVEEISPPKPKNQVVGSFTLEKSSSFAPLDITSIRATLKPTDSTVFLALHKEQEPFLQKIRDALQQHGLSCQLMVLSDKSSLKNILSTKHIKTLIMEYHSELLHSLTLPSQIEYHKFFPFSSEKRILFLHPIASYPLDIERKRHLWNSLKTLLPLSSSPLA